MRHSTSRERDTETRENRRPLERLVFVPGAIVLIYGFWLLLAA